jgi:hypothetical protein
MAEQGGSMQEGNSTKQWIDAYLDRKPAELAVEQEQEMNRG